MRHPSQGPGVQQRIADVGDAGAQVQRLWIRQGERQRGQDGERRGEDAAAPHRQGGRIERRIEVRNERHA
jgi:hypothetical protein